MALSLNNTKIVTMVCLGVVSLIVGLIPWKVYKYLETPSKLKMSIISVLLCFGAGVLMATAMIHILPETRESIIMSGWDVDGLPVAEIFFISGIFLIYFIEELVSTCCGGGGHGHSHGGPAPVQVEVEKQAPSSNSSRRSSLSSSASAVVEEVPVKTISAKSAIKNFITIVALAIHAVFEGLAVGLESNVNNVWKLFTAIAIHKYVISFCFGLELMTSKTKPLIFVLYIAIFALFSPLGIGIGLGISTGLEQNQAYYITVGVLQAISAGTIAYVVFFEIMQRERTKNVNGMLQLAATLIGFLFMMLVQIFVKEPPVEGGPIEFHHTGQLNMESFLTNALGSIG